MIGIFDSGSGGLTVAKALRELAPRADLVYFADTANMPYGTKSEEEIRRLTLQSMALLRARGATTIVSACNSVSASVILPLFEAFGVTSSTLVEMVGPAVDELVRRQATEVALFATPATVRSGMYESVGAKKGIRVIPIASPVLASQIEEGESADAMIRTIRSLLERVPSSISTVLLGCTHYPLVLELFRVVAREMGRTVCFVDPAVAVAANAIRRDGAQGQGETRVLCSERSKTFDAFSQKMLGDLYTDRAVTSVVDFGILNA
jgi:glutamate racemase